MIVAYSMYLIGLVVAILVAAVIHLIDKRKSENYLLIELPEYKSLVPEPWQYTYGKK